MPIDTFLKMLTPDGKPEYDASTDSQRRSQVCSRSRKAGYNKGSSKERQVLCKQNRNRNTMMDANRYTANRGKRKREESFYFA